MSDQPVRATIATGYKARLGLIGLVCFLFGCWAMYDGFVKYPAEAERFDAVQAWKAENPNWQQDWPAYAPTQGWPANLNDVDDRTFTDILSQYIMAAITLPIGVWFGLSFLTSGRKFLEVDDQTIRASGGRSAGFGDITSIDMTKWKTKGIAKINHSGQGKSPIVLDDWKFTRKPTEHILMTVLQAHDTEAHAALVAEQEAARQAAEEARAAAAAEAEAQGPAGAELGDPERVATEPDPAGGAEAETSEAAGPRVS
ncbi:MAG: hypothetical protein AAF288_03795 [Planctomycetota bacterium]